MTHTKTEVANKAIVAVSLIGLLFTFFGAPAIYGAYQKIYDNSEKSAEAAAQRQALTKDVERLENSFDKLSSLIEQKDRDLRNNLDRNFSDMRLQMRQVVKDASETRAYVSTLEAVVDNNGG